MVEWKDISSWSRHDSDEVRAVPKTWASQIGKFRIIVSRHIHHQPDVWVLTCHPDMFSHVEAASKDIDKAKIQAIEMLRVVCENTVAGIVAK